MVPAANYHLQNGVVPLDWSGKFAFIYIELVNNGGDLGADLVQVIFLRDQAADIARNFFLVDSSKGLRGAFLDVFIDALADAYTIKNVFLDGQAKGGTALATELKLVFREFELDGAVCALLHTFP